MVELRCGDCHYGTSATFDRVTCDVLGRSFIHESTCQVCRDGLLREMRSQEPQRDMIKALKDRLLDDQRHQEELREQVETAMRAEDYDWSAHEYEWIPTVSVEGRQLEREIGRAERDLGLDDSQVIRYLWRKTKGAENRHCPDCGWGRLDAATQRCPEHKAILVADAT